MIDPHLPFLAAICADPTSDLPRLVYADFLREQGDDARAEFIAVQCELASRGPDAGHPQKDGRSTDTNTLRRRERELLVTKAAEDIWPVDVSAWADKYTFRRGFVTELKCTAADWLAHGPAIRERHPVTHVTLTTEPRVHAHAPDRLRLDGCRWWTTSQLLDVPGGPFPTAMHRLFAAEFPGVAFELPPAVDAFVDVAGNVRRTTTTGDDATGTRTVRVNGVVTERHEWAAPALPLPPPPPVG